MARAAGFDSVWRFERGCAALTRRYGLDPDDAFVVYTLVNVYEQMAVLIRRSSARTNDDDASTRRMKATT